MGARSRVASVVAWKMSATCRPNVPGLGIYLFITIISLFLTQSNRIFAQSNLKALAWLLRFFRSPIALKSTHRSTRRLGTMASSLPSLPHVLGTDPSSCLLDAFRTAIAKRMSDRLPQLTIEQAYSGVDYGKKGVDFTVALPRFRLPGKPDELAKRVLEDVGLLLALIRAYCPCDLMPSVLKGSFS